MEKTEWVAVFYPHKFYVGRVVELPEDGNLVLKFLDRRPGDVFQFRNDVETVEQKWIFCRGLRVALKGKNGFSVENYREINKEYEKFKKTYSLKGKVRSSSIASFILETCPF